MLHLASATTSTPLPPFLPLAFPFALDINLSPGSLIESSAKSIAGIDTFREMALDGGLTTATGDTDTITIAGKRGVIDISLSQVEGSEWFLKSVGFSFDLGGATVTTGSLGSNSEEHSEIGPQTLEYLDLFLSPPVRKFLLLTSERLRRSSSAASSEVEGEADDDDADTIELQQAKALDDFRRRLSEVLWSENMLVPDSKPGGGPLKGRNVFEEMRELSLWFQSPESR